MRLFLLLAAVGATPVPANTELRAVGKPTQTQAPAFPIVKGVYTPLWQPEVKVPTINFNNEQELSDARKRALRNE